MDFTYSYNDLMSYLVDSLGYSIEELQDIIATGQDLKELIDDPEELKAWCQ